jgi:hypothetical protein
MCGYDVYTDGMRFVEDKDLFYISHKYGYHMDCWKQLDGFKKLFMINKYKKENINERYQNM